MYVFLSAALSQNISWSFLSNVNICDWSLGCDLAIKALLFSETPPMRIQRLYWRIKVITQNDFVLICSDPYPSNGDKWTQTSPAKCPPTAQPPFKPSFCVSRVCVRPIKYERSLMGNMQTLHTQSVNIHYWQSWGMFWSPEHDYS